MENSIKPIWQGEKLTPEDIKRVKGLGCLQDKRYNDVFNVRVVISNGKLNVAEQKAIATAAEEYGNGEIAMTSHQNIEILGVRYRNIEPLIRFLNNRGLETGGTGPLVRPVVSCKGTTCQYGLIDTFALSEKIHERFYKGYHTTPLPHKFKIGIGVCPNNFVKPDINDLGIVGQMVPTFDSDNCNQCKKCQIASSCPMKAATYVGVFKYDKNECNNCGRCKDKCPFGVGVSYVNGYKMYIGGRWGKKFNNGTPLSKIFTSEQELLDTIERIILFYRDEGIAGERFADTIARLGFEYVESKILK